MILLFSRKPRTQLHPSYIPVAFFLAKSSSCANKCQVRSTQSVHNKIAGTLNINNRKGRQNSTDPLHGILCSVRAISTFHHGSIFSCTNTNSKGSADSHCPSLTQNLCASHAQTLEVNEWDPCQGLDNL